jgi:hypothetical protein
MGTTLAHTNATTPTKRVKGMIVKRRGTRNPAGFSLLRLRTKAGRGVINGTMAKRDETMDVQI